MADLKQCLNKRNNFTGYEKTMFLKNARDYRKDGYDAIEANAQSIRDMISILSAKREAVVEQAEKNIELRDQAQSEALKEYENNTKKLLGENGEMRVDANFQLRVSGDGNTVEGHAAVFNKFSEDLGGFREKIAPGAFRDSIKSSDTRALFNHNPNFVLGRTSSGTLELKEDKQGLFFRTSLPNTTWANDLRVSCQRGDINQCSFGFTIETDEWTEKDDGSMERTIKKVRDLLDVSIVTFPAYPDTSVAVRNLEEYRKANSGETESEDCPHCRAKNEPETDESDDLSNKDKVAWENSPERVALLKKKFNLNH